MADVLYIHPLGKNPSFSLKYYNKELRNSSEHFFGFIPMGIIGIANSLIKNGISVKGINLPLKKRVNPSFDLIECLKFYKPRIVLIDMHWYVHINNGIEIAKICKKILDCKVIVGGLSATLFYKQLLRINEIDYVVKGDAELPILKLVKAILNNKETKNIENVASKEFDNKTTYFCIDIDNYDYIDLDFLEDKESYINMFDSWLMTGKGCPFNCKNCDGAIDKTKGIFGRNRTIFRNAETIVRELERVESETVSFSLDLELLPSEIINKISRRRFNCSLRNEFFRLADVKKLKKLNNSFKYMDLVFSPVSGDDKERKEYGKNFTNKELLDALKKIEEEDLNAGIIVYFTEHMISPIEKIKLNERARKELIKKIEKIAPYALIKIMPQIVDPGTLKERMNINKIFEYYSN